MKMLYPDRKMLKWQGMMLAEHNEQIKEEAKKIVKKEIFFDEQQHEEFDRIVQASLHLKKEVIFEMNTFGDHDLLHVKGFVSDCFRIPGQKPYLKMEGYSAKFWIDEIVSIQFAGHDFDF
ncbi:YolD-like family protein [Domibacillus epiphyticus]|uniref:YolD-like family protein n=1 Tax=Domibacillus epiphyticus TaxID=1714355 RepID=A0A1V2A589_9BACI|nr:YolD-like family protein [Domibacillus epiphyticus]OMP66168.1 hypothetical protein BTO28_13690 [Domibacillus epiphyticus]